MSELVNKVNYYYYYYYYCYAYRAMGLKIDNRTHNLLLGEGAGRKRNEVCSLGTSFFPRLALCGIASVVTVLYISAC